MQPPPTYRKQNPLRSSQPYGNVKDFAFTGICIRKRDLREAHTPGRTLMS